MSFIYGYHVTDENGEPIGATLCRKHHEELVDHPADCACFVIASYDPCEADSPEHCDIESCREWLGTRLTDEGKRYVVEAVKAMDGDDSILKVWRDEYAYLFPDDEAPDDSHARAEAAL